MEHQVATVNMQLEEGKKNKDKNDFCHTSAWTGKGQR